MMDALHPSMTSTPTKTAIAISLFVTCLVSAACVADSEEAAPRCGTEVYHGTLDISVHGQDTLNHYSVVKGDVVIGATTWINLEPLRCLQSIEGDLTIVGNQEMKTVDGAEALRDVWGTITIAHNNNLAHTRAFAGLELAGSIVIAANHKLDGLSWLSNFESLAALIVADNNSLMSLSSLATLRAVSSLRIVNNSSLGAINASGLQWIADGDLDIAHNAALGSVDLSQLMRLDGGLRVRSNTSLSTCIPHGVADRLVANGYNGEVSIYGNKQDAVCR